MTLKSETKQYTIQEYLSMEEYALVKHEYNNGKIQKRFYSIYEF